MLKNGRLFRFLRYAPAGGGPGGDAGRATAGKRGGAIFHCFSLLFRRFSLCFTAFFTDFTVFY